MKIRSTCKAIELHMPKYYNYLKDLTISEFKRVQLTHILLGHWQEFPTIQDLETHSTHSKSYFSTFIKLLKDRGVEQEKYFNWENSENSFINILQDKPIPRSFGKILEELNSPLVHILRNSVSHGIEPPKRRKSKNKNEIGTLKLKTSRRAGSIYIEIQDDGKGIDYDKIKQKIIKNGLYNSEEVKSLSKDDLNQIIIMPGFSTLSDVDIISGRGMGLAIVSEKIKELGGTFKISSEKDKGTIMTLIVPFTRAILKAQLMKVNGDLFAIPTENIDQVIIFNQNLVEYDEEQVYYNFASQLVPMIQLDQYFNFISSGESNITTNSDIKIAVLCKKDEFNSIVIVVDELLQQMDVVVKPFKSSFSNSHDILGSTITGDGSICLILDVLTMMSSILNIN